MAKDYTKIKVLRLAWRGVAWHWDFKVKTICARGKRSEINAFKLLQDPASSANERREPFSNPNQPIETEKQHERGGQ